MSLDDIKEWQKRYKQRQGKQPTPEFPGAESKKAQPRPQPQPDSQEPSPDTLAMKGRAAQDQPQPSAPQEPPQETGPQAEIGPSGGYQPTGEEGQQQMKQAEKAFKNLNLGVGYTLGLPKIAMDAINYAGGLDENDLTVQAADKLPATEEIRTTMEDFGLTYPKDEQPQDFGSRAMQNIGMLLLPGGVASKSFRTGREATAALSAAGGGKIAESTAPGKEHPMVSRAIGELLGGVAGAGTGKIAKDLVDTKGTAGAIANKITDVYKGPGAKQRASRAVDQVVLAPEAARTQMKTTGRTAEGSVLTPSQKTGDPGVARMQKTLEVEDPRLAERMEIQRAGATQELKQMAQGEGDIADFRSALETEFKKVADDAQRSLDDVRPAKTEDEIYTNIVDRVSEAYKAARKKETNIWQSRPGTESVTPSELMTSYKEELGGLTEGADPGEIPNFVRRKLGRFKSKQEAKKGLKESGLVDRKGQPIDEAAEEAAEVSTGKFVGGELVNSKSPAPDAKALHQFYSVLGRKVRKLSDESGNQNTIRILNRLREGILNDLDNSLVGDEYREAINFSKDLNKRFSEGEVGRMLGFARGDTPTQTRILDNVMTGTTQQSAQEVTQQLEKAAPENVDDLRQFLKSKFVQSAEVNGRIDTNTGKKILDRMRPVLKGFPDLEEDFSQAIANQRRVDDFAGVPQVQDMSPLAKEKSAAAIFLQQDPGDEMQKFLMNKNKRTPYLTDLVNRAKKDPSGKSVKGLKNSVGSELLKFSEKKNITEDVITGDAFISGQKFLNKLDEIEPALKNSGLLSSKEASRLKRIGKAFKNIEQELDAKTLQGGAISDMPSKMIEYPLRYFVMNQVNKIKTGGGPGVDLKTAGMASSATQSTLKNSFQDNAKQILIKSFQDEAGLDDLFKDVSELSDKEARSMLQKLRDWGLTYTKETGKPTVGGTAPAISTMGREEPSRERPGQDQSQQKRDVSGLKRRLEKLQNANP